MPEAQASRPWTPPRGPLGELTESSKSRARESLLARGELEAIVAAAAPAPDFAAALRRATVAVIAELKRSSPSKGTLDASLDAAARTRSYVAGGAAALSILTEPTRFGGSLADLRDARAAVPVPLLRKDFITHEVQVLEARAYGASAVLLIARALEPTRLAELGAAVLAAGMTPLVEIRDESELARAVAMPGAVIGVNNRDLETLVIEPEVGARMIPQVPADRIAIYESGITDVAGVERAASLGADAVLVGSSLSISGDAEATVRAFASVARLGRG
ncbi:MAG TPA: indole-3-glycerol-phosphate synthase [Gemmatimonadaceae bacterium]|nr:indole-3-glycerol-phosphate synthase [Gemmatimonadaceae bacterium]